MQRLLLDTCAALWLTSGAPMNGASRSAIAESVQTNDVWVSPFAAWEVALLLSKGKLEWPISARQWFDDLTARPGFSLAPLDADVLVGSIELPPGVHKDPADRIMIATARRLDATLVTRDGPIEAYAALGHVRVLPC